MAMHYLVRVQLLNKYTRVNPIMSVKVIAIWNYKLSVFSFLEFQKAKNT